MTANPITVWLDILTLVWLNAFTVNLQKSVAELQRSLQLDEGDASYANIKVLHNNNTNNLNDLGF